MIILDTHVWLWWVSEPSLLSRHATHEIAKAEKIGISAISCIEIATAVSRGRITLDRGTLEWLEQALELPKTELFSLTPKIAVKATQLGREFHGDPADRIIVATAILEDAVLITKDTRIRSYSAVPTIW